LFGKSLDLGAGGVQVAFGSLIRVSICPFW
jgi:hypothetical protein